MKLEVEKNQVMKKCHYCVASDYDGKCVLNRFPGRVERCEEAVKRLVEAEKGGPPNEINIIKHTAEMVRAYCKREKDG